MLNRALLLLMSCGGFAASSAFATYVNPVVASHSPDPWVIYTNGYYYHTRTTGGDVRIYRAATLQGLSSSTSATVFQPNGQIVSDIWAPELHYLDGKWYIYSCGNTVPGGFNMRMFVLEGNTQNPQGTYTYRGLIDTNLSAIDETVLVRDSDGAKFLVWSQFDAQGQSLYVGPLLNPWTLGNPRVRIATPTYAWERNGNINEGPEIIKRNGKTMILYSGSGTWSVYYCLAMLVNADGNYTNAASWTKFSNPLFAQSTANRTYCVGHGSIVRSPSGAQDWLVYHGTSDPTGDQTPKRNTRIQRFLWNSDHTPNFDVPQPAGSVFLAPDEGPGAPIRGLKGEYYPTVAFGGTPTVATNFTMDFDWGTNAPLFSIPRDFSVRWSGSLYAPASGIYTFQTVNSDGARLWINNSLLINDWTARTGPATNSGAVYLAGGEFYDLRMDYFDNGGAAVARLRWVPPGGTNAIIPGNYLYPSGKGLRGEYFIGTNFAIRIQTRLDAGIGFSWGTGIPDVGVPANSFSARWSGRLQALSTGNYTFHVLADDGVRLWVDGVLLIDNWIQPSAVEQTASLQLTGGVFYSVRLEYYKKDGNAGIQLMWTPPGGAKAQIPASQLWPSRLNREPMLSISPDANGGCKVSVFGDGGLTYVVESAVSLSGPWSTVMTTNTLASPFQFPNPGGANTEFFRARLVPD